MSYFNSVLCCFVWFLCLFVFHMDTFNYIFNLLSSLYCVFPTLMNLLWLCHATSRASLIELLLLGIPEGLLKKQDT